MRRYSGRRAIRNAALALPAAVLLLAAGCLFEPRDPEPPAGEEGGDWIVPKSPKDVFANLVTGLSAAGNSNYERSLADDFTFIPRDQDRLQFPDGTFDGWTKAVEMSILDRIKGDYQGGRASQYGDENGAFPKEDVQVGTAEFEGPYRWTLDRGDGSEPEVYSGTARFFLRQGTAGWVIYRWEDLDVLESFPTSGNLRGTFRAAG
jgi:hypothetical protein